MNRYELYINDELVDLGDDTTISYTSQINDVAKPDEFQACFTNQFNLPKTSKNKKILENSDIVNSSTDRPYTRMSAKFVVNGVELIRKGKAILDEASDTYKITVYSTEFTFFDDIKNLSINDLDLSDLDHDWNLNNIVATCVGDSGGWQGYDYVYALIDWSTDTYWINNSNRVIDVRGLFLCVYCYRLLEQIFTDQGYTLNLGVLDREPFLSEIVPTNFLNSGDTSRLLSIANTAITEYISYLPIGYQGISFEDYVYDPTFRFSWLGGIPKTVYTIPSKGTYSFFFRIYYSGYVYSHFDFHIIKNINGALTILKYNTYTANSGSIVIRVDNISFDKGDTVSAAVVLQKTSYINFFNGTFKCTSADVDEIIFGGTWDVAKNLPDISQTDFIKNICFQYNATLSIDVLNKVVTFKNFDTIYANRAIARDWSKKIDLTNDYKLEYRIGDYAKANFMRYKEDDGVTKDLGIGVLTIADDTLEKENDMFELAFAASEMVDRCVGQDVAIIKRCSGGVYNSETFEPRILLVSYRQDVNTYSYTDGVTTLTYTNKYHCFSTFINTEETYSLGFNVNLLDTFYEKFRIILTNSKLLTIKLNLKMIDVVDFDHFIPVYIEKFSSMFYVNKIKNFSMDKLTEVELIKL